VPLALCGGDEPAVANGDVNGDGSLDVSDAIHLLRWLHSGGPEPAAACGEAILQGAGGHLLRLPPIVPPDLFRPVYSLLAEKWWLWAFSIPVSEHPLFDPTGELCNVGQSGPVWYLGGSFVGGEVDRTCTVPGGKFIFFPLLNTECSSLEPEPFICSNKSECLECNDKFYSPEDELSLEIDGVNVGHLQKFRVQSRLFHFTLGEDSIFGLPAGTSGVSLADGYQSSSLHSLAASTPSTGTACSCQAPWRASAGRRHTISSSTERPLDGDAGRRSRPASPSDKAPQGAKVQPCYNAGSNNVSNPALCQPGELPCHRPFPEWIPILRSRRCGGAFTITLLRSW